MGIPLKMQEIELTCTQNKERKTGYKTGLSQDKNRTSQAKNMGDSRTEPPI